MIIRFLKAVYDDEDKIKDFKFAFAYNKQNYDKLINMFNQAKIIGQPIEIDCGKDKDTMEVNSFYFSPAKDETELTSINVYCI